jgi:gliding motility-associated protein GldL
MGFKEILASKGYKQFMAKLYGLGAAVVLIGALFKINHYPGANEMLILGLTTEALIFAASAFEPLHEDLDWTLVYPELAGMGHDGESSSAVHGRKGGVEDDMLSEKLDALLKEAQIDAELMNSLSTGLNKLSATAQSMNASTDIMGVNTNYAEQLTKLTESLGRLNALYVQQLEASAQQMEATQKAYEQASLRQAEAMQKAYENMTHIAETLGGTVEKSAQYKDEINQLTGSVNSLNKIYGGMLAAFKNIGKDS